MIFLHIHVHNTFTKRQFKLILINFKCFSMYHLNCHFLYKKCLPAVDRFQTEQTVEIKQGLSPLIHLLAPEISVCYVSQQYLVLYHYLQQQQIITCEMQFFVFLMHFVFSFFMCKTSPPPLKMIKSTVVIRISN